MHVGKAYNTVVTSHLLHTQYNENRIPRADSLHFFAGPAASGSAGKPAPKTGGIFFSAPAVSGS
eukprot:3616178-Heterocapsa_arctica.AAC.1